MAENSQHAHARMPESSAVEVQSYDTYILTSEAVGEGHPDKVADFIADSILDEHLRQDANSRVACEVLCKGNRVVVAGEITSTAMVSMDATVREAIRDVGYDDASSPFNAAGVSIELLLTQQSPEIAKGVTRSSDTVREQGAGDQGIMFGYATDETPELMPLPILLAQRLARAIAEARKKLVVNWLRPDLKTQVSVLYSESGRPISVSSVVVSTQHQVGIRQDAIKEFLIEQVLPETLGDWWNSDIDMMVNPTGSFESGGPAVDCGVTGRKIIADTYGGAGHHGGGAFSGKDPSKVDRSGAYFARYVARQVVLEGLARRAEVQVAYAIGIAHPVSTRVDTFGTGDIGQADAFVRKFDFCPGALIEQLDLLRPIYRETTNYGHFGRTGFTWEA